MMRIYISGPITGRLDTASMRFSYIETQLRQLGYKTINPFALSELLPNDFTHDEYMRVDTILLELCDAVYFMPGWKDSKGCQIEHSLAEAWGMMIFEKISDLAQAQAVHCPVPEGKDVWLDE